MKPLSTSLLGSVLLLALSGCFAAREARIESDYSYAGNFRRYHTYDFMTGDGLAADSSKLGKVLRDAIQLRLKVQGYKPAKRRPDLLVNFRVYDGDMRFRGYKQEDISRWVREDKVEDENTPKDERQGYDPVRLILTEGTLLITLIDNRAHRAVWNGYASGVSVPSGPQGEVVLRRSVRSIFDQYRVFTEGYLEGGTSQMTDE